MQYSLKTKTLVVAGLSILLTGQVMADTFSYGSVNGLEAYAGPGACGGSVRCPGASSDQLSIDTIIPSATAANTANAALTSTWQSNSATATATSNYGVQHAYAEAYAPTTAFPYPPYNTSYAETLAKSITYEVIPGANVSGGTYTIPVTITGSRTDTSGIYGASSSSYWQFMVYDLTARSVLLNNIWQNTDSHKDPSSFAITFTATAGHELSIDSDFEADAYVSSWDYDTLGNHLDVVSDYSHTLKYNIMGAPGTADLIGSSGHDYALSLSPVPEPDTWVMMLAGMSFVGFATRRKSA